MPDTRAAPRIAARHQGLIVATGRPDILCVIRNLSNSGAQLSFANPTILPRAFQLKFDGFSQRVTVVWQSGRVAGVRFQTALRGIGAQQKRSWPWSRKQG